MSESQNGFQFQLQWCSQTGTRARVSVTRGEQPILQDVLDIAEERRRIQFLERAAPHFPEEDREELCAELQAHLGGMLSRRIQELAAPRSANGNGDHRGGGGLLFNDTGTRQVGQECTDTGLAERFALQHAENVRYCHPWQKWLVWDECRWAIDQTAEVERLAKATVCGIYSEAANEPDSKMRQALAAFAQASEAASRRAAMLRLAQSEEGIPILPEALDTDPWAFNVLNGTIDLRTGQLREHSRGDFITKLAPVQFDPQAGCPTWLAFLDRIFGGNQELIGFVQRLAGYCLTGRVTEQVLPIFYGSGSNGKSTLLGTIMRVMGKDYSMKAPPDLLTLKKQASHPTERADLFGMRLVAVSETEDGSRLAESLIKDLTGGERQRARRMREDFWEFDPSAKSILSTNHRPRVVGTDHAIWRRLRLVPFEVTIPDAEQDKTLSERLAAEASGILNWMIEGGMDWQRRGDLGAPEAVTQATRAYRRDEDILGTFIDEDCVVGPIHSVPAGDLYRAYTTWADRSGEYAVNQRRFGRLLTDRGFERFGDKPKRYRGIGLRPQETQFPAQRPLGPWMSESV